MNTMSCPGQRLLALTLLLAAGLSRAAPFGSEHAIDRHHDNGDECQLPLPALLAHGEALFRASWTRDDGAGIANQQTRAGLAAATLYQATLPMPGQVIARDPLVEQAVALGAARFTGIGCAHCHVTPLPLSAAGPTFTEPRPFDPPGNLQTGQAADLNIDPGSDTLATPRLSAEDDGVVRVPACTDLKLHDLCDGLHDPDREPLDMHHSAGGASFFAGSRRFLTRKLCGVATEPPCFHHGKSTTLREAVLAHAGEASDARLAFESLPPRERDAIIEFLKRLQVLPAGTVSLRADGHRQPR